MHQQPMLTREWTGERITAPNHYNLSQIDQQLLYEDEIELLRQQQQERQHQQRHYQQQQQG